MKKSTEGLIALQFLAVALPIAFVLIAQLAADSRRAAALAGSRPLRSLATEARANYRSFTDGAADAVDTGALGRQSAEALVRSAAVLRQLELADPAPATGDAPGKVTELANALAKGATLAMLLPLREQIALGDRLTREVDTRYTVRDEAVVRDTVASAELQKRTVSIALLVSLALSAIFVLATRSRLKQQIEADAAIERQRRTQLEAISIRFNLATEAARAGVYELREQDSNVWWSDTMRALYGQADPQFQPTLESWLACIHPEDRERAAAAMGTALRECHQLRAQYRVPLPNGAVRHIESLAIVVADAASRGSRLVGIDLDVTERVAAIGREQQLQGQLREASRHAGMAEVATSVLHNVGNVLNSVNVSACLVIDRLRRSKAAGLGRLALLLREHEGELGRFVAEDERGRQLPAYLEGLSQHLAADQGVTLQELESLRRNIDHIKEVVAMQQSYAKLGGVSEDVTPAELVEECLRISASDFAQHDITLVREFSPVPGICVDCHKVLQILVNLLRNAKHACLKRGPGAHRVVLRIAPAADGICIAVHDDGVGIEPGNMTRIFSYGFTTKQEGHGFGLHSSALAAREMGGSLSASSEGPGLGATFTLELPLHPPGTSHG
jgi:signal transduction histidine kinase